MGQLLVIATVMSSFAGGYAICSEGDWQAAAEQALSYFQKDVTPLWLQLSQSRPADLSWAAIQEKAAKFTPPDDKLQCFIGLQVSHATRKLSIQHDLFFSAQCSRGVFRVRADTYLMVLHWLLATNPGLSFKHDFRFWIDLVDGSAGSSAFLEALSYPIFAPGRSPDNHYAIAIPEIYIMFSLVLQHPALLKTFMKLPDGPRHQAFLQHVNSVFSYNYTAIPWHEMQQQVVYRASCMLTINPWPNNKQGTYIYLRGEVCQAIHAVPDWSVYYNAAAPTVTHYGCYTQQEKWFTTPLCQRCRPCAYGRPMPRKLMMHYKYKINVDGLGPTFDAIYWKLASGGVTFLFWETESRPYHMQWFLPMLQPGVHYFPVSNTTLHQRVTWCFENDAACREVAENAYAAMRCKVNAHTAARYLGKALKLVHDTQYRG